jgi:hypothetical protein
MNNEQTYDPHQVPIKISITFPEQPKPYFTVTRWTDDTCKCGQPSDIGCHGIKEGVVYDEWYCERCYNKQKRSKYG